VELDEKGNVKMKKTIGLLLLILILTVGCSDNSIKDKEDSSKPVQNQITKEQEVQKQDNFVFESKDDIQNNIKSKVVINTYYEEPDSLKDKNTIILNGLMEGEFIEFIVEGEIKDFKHVELVWDEKENALVEKSIINKFDKLTNQTIVIKTYLPDGIPSEKIVWKTLSGKTYEFVIAQNG